MAKRVTLRRTEYTADFPRLDGGLNLEELPYRLRANESPEMKNLWWEDGVLQTRPGQVWATAEGAAAGTGWAAAQEPFWGHAFLHIGRRLYCAALDGEEQLTLIALEGPAVPEGRGTFFRFGEWLFYKNRGGYIRITRREDGSFLAEDMAEHAYVPTVAINADPETGSGDLYQPENRLSAQKRITYNAKTERRSEEFEGTGGRRRFRLSAAARSGSLLGIGAVYLDSALLEKDAYSFDEETGILLFETAPEEGSIITVYLDYGVASYRLPVREVDGVDRVIVDGVELREEVDYTVNPRRGLVEFTTAPRATDPPINNTVEIVYRKENARARDAVLGCPCAAVYGGGVQLCIVLGGCEDQPNAVFWSGNDDTALNPGYFPMPFYNLVGDTADGVTGFGKQYSDLIVFKSRSLGKLSYEIEALDGRESISLTYAHVNDRVGCDLPGSIQLIDNNLVFCNSYGGVYRVLDSSATYENNVALISRKVNGSAQRPGLLVDLRGGGTVSSYDDGGNYWLCVGGHCWVWAYRASTWQDPGWYFFTNIDAAAWFGDEQMERVFHMNGGGRVTRMARVFCDYGGAIEKVYQFPVLTLGGYERLKDVRTVIFSVRSDTDSETRVRWQSDYEERYDRTDLRTTGYRLSPRNLAYRDLHVPKYTGVFHRRPMCRHVRHFSMRLENNNAAQDLSIVGVRLVYRLTGRDR